MTDVYEFRTPSETRQAWMETATEKLRPYFEVFGGKIPSTLRVAIGWTLSRKHIGECFHSTASSDQHREIFISPALADGSQILGVLVHELVHACLPDDAKHGPLFKSLATAVGLAGKMTATTVGPALQAWIDAFIIEHGEYPAGSIDLSARKKQTTYLIKCECQTTGYTIRITQKWITEYGTPLCPCCSEAMPIMS